MFYETVSKTEFLHKITHNMSALEIVAGCLTNDCVMINGVDYLRCKTYQSNPIKEFAVYTCVPVVFGTFSKC